MNSRPGLPASRALKITAVLLFAALATCVERPTAPLATQVSALPDPLTATLTSAPISQALLTSGNDTTKRTVYTTAPISPAPNTLITVAVMGHRSSGVSPSPTVTGGGMSAWTEVATVTFDTVGLPRKRITIFRAMSASPGSGPITITYISTQSNAQWIVSQWDGVDITGLNGAGAIVQTGSARADAAYGLAVTLAPFANANNAAYGVFGVRKSVLAIAPGVGFTEIAEQPSAESPYSDLQAEWATNDNTIDATWIKLNGGALGIEIRAGNGEPPAPVVSPTLSTVTASPTSIALGGETSTITVTAKDASGAPMSGVTVVLSATGTGNTLTQPVGPTDASGVATGTLSSTDAGTKSVSATANGTALTGVDVIAGTPPPPPPDVSPSLSTVTANPTSIMAGGETSTITVTVKDASGAPISGATVVLSASGTGNTLTQPAGPTDAAGVATGTLSSTGGGSKIVSATANGTAITQTATVEVMSHPVSSITPTLLTSGNNPVNLSSYTTASISPVPNTLITVAVMGHRSSGANPSPIVTGGGMAAWTEVATVTLDPLGLPLKRMTIFRAMSATPGSGPITIKFASSVSNAQWIVSQWDGVDITGVNGAGAIVQAGSARADAASGLTVTLAAFENANNAAYGVFGVRGSVLAVTPGAGFMELAEHPSAESPASDLQAEWTTNDNTIDASWTNLNGAALGVEIRAGNTGPRAPVVSVDVTPASSSILVGGTAQLTAAAQDAEGQPLSGRTFIWTTDAPAVATVSGTGLVTGVGAGSATITATSEGKSGTANVTVASSTVPVASVEVAPTTASISVGGTVQLSATAKDAAGQPLTGRAFTWASNAPTIAQVSAGGLVTGMAEGPATITATSEGQSGSASVTVTVSSQLSQLGSWSSVISAPMIFVHVHLLPNGKVLVFGKGGVPQVWDPATGSFTAVPSPSLLFCAGHDLLPDGRVLVVGGHISSSRGLPNTNIFDFVTNSWQVGSVMAQGRWYPTTTTLPNGEVLTLSGTDENGATVPLPEIWNGSSWRQLTTAPLALPNYPRMFVLADGRVYYAGSEKQTRFLDVTGTGSWTDGPQRQFGGRSYGSAVMYEPGKIMYVGGSNPPTATAEIIDFNQPTPQWAFTGSLARARWNLNATLLPTGEVLATGGVSGDRANPALYVNTTELWNPATGFWTTLASSAPMLRGYHSSSLLLPDGRVLHGGGGDGGGTVDNLSYELYSPPYLFKGARPVVTGVTPDAVSYGQSLVLETPDGAAIAKVSLIRFGSVTHAFDSGSRLIPLSFTQVAGGISVTIPGSRTIAPPGPYMLFLVNGNGVPSIARTMIVR